MSSVPPSANWLALKRTLSTGRGEDVSPPAKRRKVSQHTGPVKLSWNSSNDVSPSLPTTLSSQNAAASPSGSAAPKIVGDPDSKENLAAMILRTNSGKGGAKPTKFLAMDCEMVGVGPFGLESVLARVTMVNYVGDVVLDEFVLPQETVTDWRTAVSGVRKENMANAKTFVEVQALVSELLKDRVLVGHALSNDLTALLLSHPWLQTRDTQGFAPFRAITKSKRPALRKLVKAVFDITIQEGEHSSVIDARAPMALYRLYRKQWETRGIRQPLEVTVQPSTEVPERSPSPNPTGTTPTSSRPSTTETTKPPVLTDTEHLQKSLKPVAPPKSTASPRNPSKQKKKQGISSGLSVIVTRNKPTKSTLHRAGDLADGPTKGSAKTKAGWWKVLGT